MKALVNDKSFHILQGPAVKLQKSLDMMAERYDITIHAVNIVANGDAVIVVERRKTERQKLFEDVSGV